MVLTRKRYERVKLSFGDLEMWVSVSHVSDDGRVRLGFHGPLAIRVEREEIVGKQWPESDGTARQG